MSTLIVVQRDAASMTLDAQGNWVFTLSCGHQTTISFNINAGPKTALDCQTCINMVAAGQAIPQ